MHTLNTSTRRQFLATSAASAAAASTLSSLSFLASPVAMAKTLKPEFKPLILIELKGGNDGLNTWIPRIDSNYRSYRPSIHLADKALPTTAEYGLHPALTHLQTLWQQRQLAIIQGVGYPDPNLSHFRSIDIWDTGSQSQEVLRTGWLTRAFSQKAASDFRSDVVLVGSQNLGPAMGGARGINLNNAQAFANQAKLAQMHSQSLPGVLGHIAQIEGNIANAAIDLKTDVRFSTEFTGPWANVVRVASTIIADKASPVVRLTLNGFDTHRGQLGAHQGLMAQLNQGISQLQSALTEHQLWEKSLILTYSEFGRRPRENASDGTDHGTASVMFATGGVAKPGVFGVAPSLSDLDSAGNLKHTVDFRDVYASILGNHWLLNAQQIQSILGAGRKAVPFLIT